MSRLGSLLLASAVLFFHAAAAQTSYGVSMGITGSNARLSQSVDAKGIAAQGMIAWRVAPGWRIRTDAFVNQFPDNPQAFVCPERSPCACPTGVCAAPPSQPVGLATLTTNLMFNLQSRGVSWGGFLIGGAGAYYLYQHPTAQGAVRPDLTAGAGVSFRVAPRSMLFVEARYHRLLDNPGTPSWILPVTLGVAF